MPDDKPAPPEDQGVAYWHTLSGAPDDVTDEGIVVHLEPGAKAQADKETLRATAQRLAHGDAPYQVRTLARLAASYLLAGDVETAGRYLDQATRILEAGEAGSSKLPAE